MPDTEGKTITDVIYPNSTTPICPESLDTFMQGLEPREFLGKLVVSPTYWDQRIDVVCESLRQAEIARGNVATLASDAQHFMRTDPESFAHLPEETQTILGELASRTEEQ